MIMARRGRSPRSENRGSVAGRLLDKVPDGGRVHLGVHPGVAASPAPETEAGDAYLASACDRINPHRPAAIALAGIFTGLARCNHEATDVVRPVNRLCLVIGDDRYPRLAHPVRVVCPV